MAVEFKEMSVKVTKESYELSMAVNNLVSKIVEVAQDGWETGSDLPVILTTAMTELLPAMQGLDKIKDEKEFLKEFIMALSLPMVDLGLSFIPTKEA